MPLCAYVIVIPDESKIIVFHKGKPKASTKFINKGGHTSPRYILGDKLVWKKAQKKLKKNIISDVINKIIPA